MEPFRTSIQITPSEHKLTYENSAMFMGSCFTENIGNLLAEFKMPVDVNPFGIIYNPVSVKNSIDILLRKKFFTTSDLHFLNEQWFSFYHHSRFSNEDSDICLKAINERIQRSSGFIKEAEFLFITFGTARVYRYNKTGEIVSNCHKIPAGEFTEILLSAEDIVNEFTPLIQQLQKINKKINIIFTVSPIRHWKDGAEDNMLSKAILIVSVHKLMSALKQIYYFPSFEIMMDDLRDYRFYEEDMLHPNPVALKYIRKKFSETFFDEPTLLLQKEIEKIIKARLHKPFNSGSENHAGFIKKNIALIESLESKYPFLNFKEEKEYFVIGNR
ncbi:MAG: GSCFA domain-containing protein [Bacteroidetes bacterium]|nr:GSCFA domain-containing protein [Bacteroidota bacterium]